MDDFLAKLIDKKTPKLNPLLADGLAVSHLAKVEEYLEAVFRSAAKSFPKGVTYEGCDVCSPTEEFNQVTEKKGSRRRFDVARTDVYMVKYKFAFNGEPLPPKYMWLPFVERGGYITINGSRFNISPVLSDRVISVPNSSTVFIRLLRDRITVKRMTQNVLINGMLETIQVPWAMIYHRNDKMKQAKAVVKAECTLAHYLFCKYGFTETFRRFGNCEVVVGGSEIHEVNYPPDKWVICVSTGNMHRRQRSKMMLCTDIRIAVPKEKMTPFIKSMVAAFLYVATIFPERVLPDRIDSRRMWMTVMGHIIFSGQTHDGKLHDDVVDHIDSLDEYLDDLVKEKLADIGVHVNDIYDLLALTIDKYSDWVIGANDKIASMYDKEASVLYYVLYEITSSIFNMCYRLKAAAKKGLQAKDVNNILNLNIRQRKIFSLTKWHGEVSNTSSSGDNMAFKITSMLIPQASSDKRTRHNDAASIKDPSKRLHSSIAAIGSFANLPKSSPDGRSRINLHVQLDSKGVVLRNPETREMLDKVDEMLRR